MAIRFSRLLLAPFILYGVWYFVDLQYRIGNIGSILLVLSVVMMALIYVFQYQIDIWYWQRRPPQLPVPLRAILARHYPYFTYLDEQTRKRYEQLLALFLLCNEFTVKREKDYALEEDIKLIIAVPFVLLGIDSWQKQSQQLRIVVYEHAFATPDVETLHRVETNVEDRTIVYARPQILQSADRSADYFDCCLWSAIELLIRENPRLAYPDIMHYTAEEIAQGHQIDLAIVQQATGHSHVSKLHLLLYNLFKYPTRLAAFDMALRNQLVDAIRSRVPIVPTEQVIYL